MVAEESYISGAVAAHPDRFERRHIGPSEADIQAMLAEGRDCRDVVTQLSAVTKALEQTSFLLVAAGLTWCVSDPERAAAEGYSMDDVKKMFLKIA